MRGRKEGIAGGITFRDGTLQEQDARPLGHQLLRPEANTYSAAPKGRAHSNAETIIAGRYFAAGRGLAALL
jgi:hypothetical protein